MATAKPLTNTIFNFFLFFFILTAVTIQGCKFRCRAEKIPVDANDPVNSAYHYRCVCHR
ncbi:hypothetical protein MKX03_015091 [Papaver bracteatum]|nr:hypothetical protein MKX03_015091 [Papaver bracteatum]